MHTHTCTDTDVLKSIKYLGSIKEDVMTFSWLKRSKSKETKKERAWKAKIKKLIHSGVQKRGKWTKDWTAEEDLMEGSDELQLKTRKKIKLEWSLNFYFYYQLSNVLSSLGLNLPSPHNNPTDMLLPAHR